MFRTLRPITRRALALGTLLLVALLGLLLPLRAARHDVPSTIASDCSRDVSRDLERFIAGVPSGSTVRFPSRRCYRVDSTINLPARNLRIDGQGSWFREITPAGGTSPPGATAAIWSIEGGTGPLVLTNIKTRGINTSHAYVHNREWQHGVALRGASNVTIDHYTSLEVGGDGVAIEGDARGDPAHNVRVTKASIRHAGRQGVFAGNVDGLRVEHAYIDATGYGVGVDIEPDRGTDREYNITIGPHVTVASNRVGAVRVSGPVPGTAKAQRIFKNITVTDVTELQCPSGYASISIRNEPGYLGDDLRVTHNRVLNNGQAIQLRPNGWNNVDIQTGNQTKPCGSAW